MIVSTRPAKKLFLNMRYCKILTVMHLIFISLTQVFWFYDELIGEHMTKVC